MTTTTRYTVTAPTTPGAVPLETHHATLAAARRHAATYADRRDLHSCDVAIRVYRGDVCPANFVRIEYVGPHR